jgi:uncharacterized membrane protein YraQ (UPF0718 family)
MDILETIKMFLIEFWDTTAQMSVYLIFGFFIAGILSVFLSPAWVEKQLGGKGYIQAIKASIFGVPLPLCSCGVIPVSMSLRKHKASKSAVISFLLSTPQTGVDSILVTYSLLGPVFAIFRPVIAFITGCIGGFAVEIFDKPNPDNSKQDNRDNDCQDECCNNNKIKTNVLKRIFKFSFITLPKDIAGAMLIGLVVAAVLSAIIPEDFFAGNIGKGLFSMLIMLFLGIPVYVCATASVPIAAVLLAKGLSPGAVLVFLMAGPATNAVSFMTVAKSLGYKSAIIYLATVAVCAVSFGLLLDYIYRFDFVAQSGHIHSEMINPYIANISAVLLLIMLFWAVYSKTKKT